MKYYIGIDLGGTNIVAGVVNESYEILAKASVKTNLPRPEEEIAADMAKVSKEAAEQAGLTMADIEWIGVGTPGVANSATGVIEYSNNLGFHNTPMVKYRRRRWYCDRRQDLQRLQLRRRRGGSHRDLCRRSAVYLRQKGLL